MAEVRELYAIDVYVAITSFAFRNHPWALAERVLTRNTRFPHVSGLDPELQNSPNGPAQRWDVGRGPDPISPTRDGARADPPVPSFFSFWPGEPRSTDSRMIRLASSKELPFRTQGCVSCRTSWELAFPARTTSRVQGPSFYPPTISFRPVHRRPHLRKFES